MSILSHDSLVSQLRDDLLILTRVGKEQPHWTGIAVGRSRKFLLAMARAMEPELWRVYVGNHPTAKVEATFLGMGDMVRITGKTVNDLPKWMQERISVLNMLSENPPTTPIAGVGRRITESVYWIVE